MAQEKVGRTILVCGGRTYQNYAKVDEVLRKEQPGKIVEGGAQGADLLAQVWGKNNQVPVETFPARWETEGKYAGWRRNQRMLDEAWPDLVIAFPGGRGTEDMKRRAKRAGVPLLVITDEE